MQRNVEIKAMVKNFPAFYSLAKELSDTPGKILNQVDTFFNCANGRLKLRRVNQDPTSKLIFYKRSDKCGPKLSDYSLTHIQESEKIESTLAAAYGIKGEVKKKRTLFHIEQTRIHVDEVENLGTFMELEVVLRNEQSVEDGETIAHNLMEKLGIDEADLISVAYIDLLHS